MSKKKDISFLFLWIVIIASINIITSFTFKRIDLTSDNRYSLTDATKNILRNLDDVVFVKVYLEGDFPEGSEGFVKLRNATKEMLDEFHYYANGNLEYEFVDPFKDASNGQTQYGIIKQLQDKGLFCTTLKVSSDDGNISQKNIIPGAIVSYKGRELPFQILQTQIAVNPELVLNNSIQSLEYNISSVIRNLTVNLKPKIAFIEGHGELNEMQTKDINDALQEYYQVERLKIDGKLDALKTYKAIIIAKPDSAFDEKDKFIIDQFVMNGGKLLWFIDNIAASMDSLVTRDDTYGIPLELNLNDQLFKYGVRINSNLLLDVYSIKIPMVVGNMGNQPQMEMFPWFYFPLIFSNSDHPIVKNLNAVRTEFVSSIDTVESKNIKKTILLTTSNYSKAINAPVRISLELARHEPRQEDYNDSNQSIAVLLEGEFQSNFKNRIPENIAKDKEIGFLEKSRHTQMIIVSDGDMIKNNIRKKEGKSEIDPLGYDKYTHETYGNKNFVLNAVNYLLDENGLIDSRSKELKLRLLNASKIKDEKIKWQAVNLVLPIFLISIGGFLLTFIRKYRFAKK
jgi:ABC-2 type transport system permease protein